MNASTLRILAKAFLITLLVANPSGKAQIPTSQLTISPVKFEAGSPQAALKEFLDAARNGDTAKVEMCWNADTKDAKDFIKLATDAIVGVGKLDRNVRTKFGEHDRTIFIGLPDDSDIAAGIDETSDNVHNLKSGDTRPWTFPMIKTDKGWKISADATLRNEPHSPLRLTKMITIAANQVAADLDSGRIKTAKEMQPALEAAASKAEKEINSPATQPH